MIIQIKDPEKAEFLHTTLAILIFFAIVAVVVILSLIINGGEQLWDFLKDFIHTTWQRKPFDCIMLFLFVGALLLGAIAFPSMLLRNIKKWGDPKRIRQIHFAREGIYLISDIKTLLPYERTALELIIHISSRYDTKHHTYTALIKYAELKFTYEDMTYCVQHVPTKKLLYQLADCHENFEHFKFDALSTNPHVEEEQALAQHWQTQLENQIRYGMHCNYVHRNRLLITAIVFDVISLLLIWDSKTPTFSFVAAGILFLVSSVLLFLWARDYTIAKKIEKLSKGDAR